MTLVLCDKKDCVHNKTDKSIEFNYCQCSTMKIKTDGTCDSYFKTPDILKERIKNAPSKLR